MIFKLRVDSKHHEHIRFTIFAGEQEGSLGNCGELCMRVNEYERFKNMLTNGAALMCEDVARILFDVRKLKEASDE